MPRYTDYERPRRNSFYCTAKNSLPLPNFQVRPNHILFATSSQFFRYLWFMPLLGACSLCFTGFTKLVWIMNSSYFFCFCIFPIAKCSLEVNQIRLDPTQKLHLNDLVCNKNGQKTMHRISYFQRQKQFFHTFVCCKKILLDIFFSKNVYSITISLFNLAQKFFNNLTC